MLGRLDEVHLLQVAKLGLKQVLRGDEAHVHALAQLGIALVRLLQVLWRGYWVHDRIVNVVLISEVYGVVTRLATCRILLLLVDSLAEALGSMIRG